MSGSTVHIPHASICYEVGSVDGDEAYFLLLAIFLVVGSSGVTGSFCLSSLGFFLCFLSKLLLDETDLLQMSLLPAEFARRRLLLYGFRRV